MASPFHRVLPEFMAQAEPRLTKAQAVLGTRSNANVTAGLPPSFSRTMSMAHAGRDTGNSQFFLTFVPTPT